ncbi:M48 family metallopeptidase [Candidatus Saccharibacteria bacterium]|jgi:predicted metal-dependent hydrolase|nr:M48 family metallopeptidase [Candidatus Saccharibacteria bacterium]
MNTLHDKEFGEIKITKVASSYIRIKVGEDRRVSISMPSLTPIFMARKFLEKSRPEIRRKINSMPKQTKKMSEAEKKALRKLARPWLQTRLRILARTHGFKYEKVRIMNARTRWGSCSSRGTVSLNIALMRIPETLRDYVILHELTHTRYMNHSKEFWAELAKYYPEYKEARKRMKKYSPQL